MNKIITSIFAFLLFSQSSAFAAENPNTSTVVEEVLSGLEITREELIIPVISTGCTQKSGFNVDVDKGSTLFWGAVYRLKPDYCRSAPRPIKLSFTKEGLGLEGRVEFTLQNKTGNPSNGFGLAE